MPETPDSTKGQTSDGDTSRLESPKTVKPVLGKVQAKKRLMAFANQFKALPKSQVKPNMSQHSTGTLKTKDKTIQDDINKSRKKTEEKILAIEEIRREESKSKMLLAEAMAAASMEDENHIGKNISSLLESKKHTKERRKYEEMNNDRKSRSVDRKYSERSRQHDKINKDSSNQDMKNRNESIERFTQKSSQNRGKHKKDKKKKNDKDKRSNSKTDTNRDKKEGKDKKETIKEKEEETKEKIEAIKNKKESIKERQNDMSEMEVESKDKKEKDKDKWKEKVLLKSNSWAELRKSGLTLDDTIHFRRRNNSERSIKIRTTQDYARYFEQMLMLNNHRLKRQSLIAEGLNGPKKYPPESIKLTKRARGLQLLYCENPRISLLLNISQLLQVVTPERREKIQDICEASLPRIDTEDTMQQERNWYQQINTTDYHKDASWQMTIQFPKSKWDSEDEEISSINIIKEEIEKSVNKLHVSVNQQERCSTTSSITDEDKIVNSVEGSKEDNKSNEKIIENISINESSSSSLLQPAGNEKLASEYEQFMKMVCTATDVTKKYSPKKYPVKSTSPHSYHEFNIESNLVEDNNIEIPLKEKFEKKNNLETLEESTKSTECEESTMSTDCQIQVNENNIQIEHMNENDESQDSKSIPSDWENVRIKVERLSDENTESREVKKKKKKKMTSSSDSSSSITSSDSEKQKKKRKRKRKVLSNSSSSDSDSTDSTSSSDSSSSEERRKRKRKKKKIGKKRKKVKRIARIKKKRRRKMSTDSNSSDLDEYTKKKKRKKKMMETKSINNGDIREISKSPVIASSDGKDIAKILHSVTPTRKIKEEAIDEDKKRIDQVISTKKNIVDISVHDNECLNQRKERKESKSDENFMEQWEMDSVTKQQNDGETSSQDRSEELEKMDGLEKNKYRRKRKYSRDNIEQDKDRSSKDNEERIHEGKARLDEEIEAKRKKRKEKDIKSSGEFLANWERESERIAQRIQNETKYLKKLGKQKKEKWGETDFDTLNVPSLTQLEKEVYQKQLLADEWEVDSLEAISDLIMSKRKISQGSLKKTEKEVKYDKKTDTYIAVEKESIREMKKKQERLYAIRIWEEEQEEGEREEMMLLEQKSKTNDWDIEEKPLFHETTEKIQVCKVNDIVAIQKEWAKTDENKDIKEDANKLIVKSDKRIKKSRWDIGSQSEEKLEAKDMWEEEYVEWSKIDKCEGQEFERTKKGELCSVDYSESSSKSDLIDFYHRKLQSRESLERSWVSDEVVRPIQAKNDASIKQSILAKTNEEQLTSIKEHQTRDQFNEISETDVKFKENTYSIKLYSPSSPALSQKSQDVELSNESSSCNSLLREKRKKEMLITADELSIPMSGIPLQLIKRDTKHTSSEKAESILNKIQLEDRDSAHNFDIKATDNLFDDISINEPCLKIHTSRHIDIFAEYGEEKSCDKQHAANFNVNSATKDDEMNEGKNALKLIPKQLLIRRTNEQVKSKRILETPLQDPAQHAAALLTIQKKLLESHALKNDIKEYPNQEQIDHFEQKYSNRDIIASNSRIDNALLDATEFSVVSKASVIAIRRSRSPTSEKAVSVRSEQSENYDRESKNDDAKRYKTNRNLNETNVSSNIRSPIREHRKRSPSKKESEKRYSHDKDKKEKKSERISDDIEKSDRRDTRNSKTDFADRRRFSPSGRGRRKKSRSPYVSWERQGSGSRSPGHSWSRSRSKSPKRKDDTTICTRDKDKKRERYDDERLCKSRTDERKERYTRSPLRFGYNEDNFKKHGIVSSKSNRNDWSRRRHDNTDRDEKDTRLYDPLEILRERTMESEKYRDNRFHIEELDHWQYESNNILRDGNESMDSYTVGQDLPLEYDDRSYYREGSLERDMIQSSPQLLSKYRRRSNVKRERQWEKDIDPSDLDHHPEHRIRNRTQQRSRYSPLRQERFRRKSRSRSWSPLRSRSRSRSRSGSRSRSTSRSRLRMRSQSRSRSRSPFDVRSRVKSVSTSRVRSPEHLFRMSELRSSRSPSPGSDRLNEIGRERKDDDENKKFSASGERGRRIETIIQSGIMSGASILDSEMGINNSMDATVTNFQYSNEGGNEYYYTENNLTYPPCIDESSTSSPKRLSLDDRLELELGIKKQHNKDSTGIASEYSSNFNPNVIAYPSPPPLQQQQQQQPQQQMMYRQPTVVQVGNVLQVVPADFNGVQSARREVSATITTPPVRSGSSQVVRVGNVLQVVPTSLDWSSSNSGGGGSGSGQSSTGQSNVVLYSSAVPAPSPSAPMSIPVPVPVPLPVPPTLPVTTNTLAPVATMSSVTPLPLSLPVPVPVPVPIPPATAAAFPRNEIQTQKIVQPVYNYEAILETRRKEQEERKRIRELRRKEKERRRIERINRRALRLLEKNNTSRQISGVLLDHRKSSSIDPAVLKALKEGDEQVESPSANPIKEEEEATMTIKEEDEDVAMDEEEDDDEDEIEAEAEDDEEEEEEVEDEDEDDGDDEKSLQMINQRIDEATTSVVKDQAEIDTRKEWPVLPSPPLKGILVVPGFSPNGNLDDLSDADNNIKDSSDKDGEIDKNNEYDKDAGSDVKPGKSNLAKLKKTKKNKKSVQFADGVKPGEGTSPSGGEGDMPSPPPPKGIDFREGLGDLKRDKIYNSRKSRKQEKRTRPPKAKKKVKVKIIKLKKPRITPLTAMMMDDSDEIDDRSPPPPPPGSPPPPHLWPSYLSIYNTTVRAIEQPQTTTATLTSVQAPPPPPTPLPLLIPPPPLNYTIQPCSKS
ncbi:hypothetical protein ALC53_09031 [Atta colombica]|uniref:Uncharacterized protein n=2 Tax=Atta colombica TaxID=520822 RepID=A0A195B7J0_9HYME|nr:hypothetical protein ALC53_09031 [Atta colombica]